MAVTDARIRFCQVAARRGHRLKGGLCPCCTSLIKVGQGCHFARAAVRSCGSLRKRRELAICLTFVPLNAEIVACRRSKARLSVKGFSRTMAKSSTRESPPQRANNRKRRRNAYDYDGEYEFPTVQHWTAPVIRSPSALRRL